MPDIALTEIATMLSPTFTSVAVVVLIYWVWRIDKSVSILLTRMDLIGFSMEKERKNNVVFSNRPHRGTD